MKALVVLACLALTAGGVLLYGWLVMLAVGVVASFTSLGTLGYWPSCGLGCLLSLLTANGARRRG